MTRFKSTFRKERWLCTVFLACTISLAAESRLMPQASESTPMTENTSLAQTEKEADAIGEDSTFAGSGQTGQASEGLYHENKWNYVEDSMDISGGIPEEVFGRLSLIRERGVLRVVTDPYFAPQEFIDPDLSGQDQYQGADMKLAALIAEKMNVELEIIPLDFTQVLSSMTTGEYDLAISALSYTPGRASSMELSKGYYYASGGSGAGLLIRKEDADVLTGPDDLSGKNLVVQQGSLQELLVAQNLTDYDQFRRVPSIQEVYDLVSNGVCDAAGVDTESAQLYINNNPDCNLTLMKGVVFDLEEQFEGDRIAGPKDDLELMYFINGVIDEVLSSGLYDKWYKEASARAAELGL